MIAAAVVQAVLAATLAAAPAPRTTTMVRIEASTYRSPVEKNAAPVAVRAFSLDETPVTNAAFLAFVVAHPQWQRDRVGRLYAEDAYLSSWQSPTSFAPLSARAPVTHVSWFAARAYCDADGKRLPTTAEWEVAAHLDNRADVDRVLAWYATQSNPRSLRDVGGAKNPRGVRDLHGLVWEWTDDFSASLVAADARSQNDGDAGRFCGGGAQNAADPSDYASFMRFAFRGSLEGNHTIGSLGFRCAKDLR